jgi:hypothetical protein
MQSITLSEFLSLALLDLASRDETHQDDCWLREDPSVLHPTVEELTLRYQDVLSPLKRLHFVKGGAFNYSGELAQAFDLLQQSGIIRRENPSLDRFAPNWLGDSKEEIERMKKRVFEEDAAAAEAFQSFVADLGSELREKNVA